MNTGRPFFLINLLLKGVEAAAADLFEVFFDSYLAVKTERCIGGGVI